MLLLSQSKKIAFIALSLFFVSLSIVFVVSSQQKVDEDTIQTNAFSTFFGGHEKKTSSEDIEMIHAPAIALTRTGEFSNLNMAFTEQFGYGKDAFFQSKFFSLIHTDDLSNFIGALTKVGEEKEKEIYSGPFRLKIANGSYHLVILSMTARESFVNILFKDITDSIEELEKTKSPEGRQIKNLEEKDGARIVVEKG